MATERVRNRENERTKIVRIPDDTFDVVRTIAEAERRSMGRQIAVMVDGWMAANGYTVASRTEKTAKAG